MTATTMEAAQLSSMLGDWVSGGAHLADDLATALVELIDSGLVPAGVGLPAQRTLAGVLGVSRGTVSTCYASLEARGYLVSLRGSGSRVRSGRSQVHGPASGRLFSFTSAPSNVIDLSSGALPASRVAAEVIASARPDGLEPYLPTDGYFPAGLPVLRQAIAEQLTRDGIPTAPQEVLVTAGAQQATWLTAGAITDPGDLALVEEPSYRGALEALRLARLHIQGIRLAHGGVDVDHVRRAAARDKPAMLYCQTSIHNPTGRGITREGRQGLAETINREGLVTVEDCCSADLTYTGPAVAPTLAGLVEPDLLILVGTTSKLFWGGLRVGWIRASRSRIRGLVERRKSVDLASSVSDQMLAVQLLRRVDEARGERRAMLSEALRATEHEVSTVFPDWSWERPQGGSGLWIDTGRDAAALAEAAKRKGVKLAPGPGFSVYGGMRSHLRLPIWHEPEQLRRALISLAA